MKKTDKLDDYIAQLNAAADLIEKDDVAIEQAIDAYEKGALAYKACLQILENCEQRIKQIGQSLEETAADE